MISRTHRRRSILGQSFTTCLLVVVLFFGGIGTYYFKVFRFRDLEDPKASLTYVKKDDPAEMAFFRKKTVPDFVDPARQQMDHLIKLRKSTKGGTVVPDDYDQDYKEIINKLIDIMDAAKLRQIPIEYKKKYEEVLVAISDIYRSALAMQEAVDSDLPADKQKKMTESINYTKSATRRFAGTREFFYVR